MATASHDDSRAPTMSTVLNTDGSTIVALTANASNSNSLSVDDNTTGTDHGPAVVRFDENHVPTLYALSSAGDGTVVALYGLSNGKLTINHT